MDELLNVPYFLKQCPQCLKSTENVENHERYGWCKMLFCKVCKPVVCWFVCLECANMSVHMSSEKQLQRHFYLRHKKEKVQSFKSDVYSGKFGEDQKAAADISELDKKSLRVLISKSFERAENCSFFEKEISGDDGIAYLIGRACFNDDSIGTVIDPGDVELNYLLAKMSLEMTRNEREKFSQILFLITKKFSMKPHKNHITIDLPQTMNGLRQRFMEGSYAVLSNLPYPEVYSLNDFSYVKLFDCVSDLLAHGVSIDPLTDSCLEEYEEVKLSGHSKAAKKIYQRAMNLVETPDIVLAITEWSDGFQPNTSTKQNRGGVYVKTISFSIPENSRWKNSTYTYCIAVGPSNQDPEAIEKVFSEDLLNFQKVPLPRIFSKEKKRLVSVYLEVLCVLQDQPERRKCNHLSYGNSNFHPRWTWSCDVKSILPIVPSCSVCSEYLRENKREKEECDICLSWDFEKNVDLLRYGPPHNFPEECTTNGILVPFKLSYNVLKKAVDMAHNKLITGSWKPTVARSYLSVFCVNTETVKLIVNNALNCKLLEEIRNNRVRNQQLIDEVRELERNCPEDFCQWKYPSVWCRNLELYQHIDTIMHLLFLGGSKTLLIDGHNMLTSLNQLSTFQKLTEYWYEDIQSLNVDWCKALPYGTGKFGAHVSENYLACTRLFKWYYHCLSYLEDDELNNYQEPNKPYDKWTKSENMLWLRQRGLPTKGNAEELRNRVRLVREDPDDIPEVIPSMTEITSKYKSTIVSWVNVVALIMQPTMTKQSIESIRLSTKVFLNHFNEFDKVFSDKNSPSWLRHFNFMSLLNIPSVVTEIGPLRNYWEGGICGEAIISYIKPEINMGLRRNWSSSLLKKIMRKKAFDSIDQSKILQGCDKERHENIVLEKYSYFQYSGVNELRFKLGVGHPISCICSNGKLFSVLKDSDLVELFVNEFTDSIYSMLYFSIGCGNVTKSINSIDGSDVDYGILLPKRIENMDQNYRYEYTLITRSWRDLNEEKKLVLPPL